MQNKTWTLKLADGRTYEGLAGYDAVLALARLTYGSEPVQEPVKRLVPAVAEYETYETPLAA